MNRYKRINSVSIIIFSVAILIMIIGLGLLSSEVSWIQNGITMKTNGFALISSLEASKHIKIPGNDANGMLDIFKNVMSSIKNIGNIRCGVIFTVFFTPILLFISFVGFGYNYFKFYKFYKSKN